MEYEHINIHKLHCLTVYISTKISAFLPIKPSDVNILEQSID